MSKIQDALAKLQKAGVQPGAHPGKLDPVQARKAARGDNRQFSGHSAADLARVTREDKSLAIDRGRLEAAGFLVPENDQRVISESFRRIKRPLIQNMDSEHRDLIPRANVLAMSSAASGEGKTFTCINLALSISQERDLSVLLVDGDLLKPQLSALMGVSTEPGLMDILTGGDLEVKDVVLRTDVPGLTFIPAGKTRQLTTELLGSRRMESLVELLSSQDPDRVVIFDTSPILQASDAVVLAGHAGQIVMVVKAGGTLQQDTAHAIDSLDKDKPINLILNQVRLTGDGGTYGYYGYGYADDATAAAAD